MEITDNSFSKEDMRLVEDTLYVLNGKWKLLIILSLCNSKKRYNEILKDIPKITSRMLSKELKELELNNLVRRDVYVNTPVVVEYQITEYSKALGPLLEEMVSWGRQHRKILFKPNF